MITFTPEEAEVFSRIHAEYVIRFEPRDQVESDLVDEIVRAKWQMRQAWAYETSTIGMQMSQDAANVDRDWKSIGEQDRRALAYAASLKENNIISNLQRYARSLALQAERATNLLLELKQHRLPPAGPDLNPVESTDRNDVAPAQEADVRNEPNPDSEHPAAPVAIERRTRTIHEYAIGSAEPRVRSQVQAEVIQFPATQAKAMTAGASSADKS